MSRVLRGSTAELPPAKYRSLDRKQSRSPRLNVSSSAAASPTSSQQSTPVRTLHAAAGGRSGGGGSTGSLPRNVGGKMPLCGKVAGYRQPPLGPFGLDHGGGQHHNGQDHHHHHHHNQHNNHLNHHRLSNAGSGLSSRSRGSDPQGNIC
jgi:hypothetical protein